MTDLEESGLNLKPTVVRLDFCPFLYSDLHLIFKQGLLTSNRGANVRRYMQAS